ncbi:MAG: CHAD domain-containing protein [Pseudanabaena sp.]|jgi:CHAD domain-containing protein
MKDSHFDRSLLVSDYAYHIIQQSLQRFVDQEEAVFQDQDPEALHQMRVGMRRFRTAIQVFGKSITLPHRVNNSSIGKIARILGETRDLDVLKQDLITRYHPLLQQSEQDKFEKVLHHLHQKRGQSFLKLKKILKSDRYQTLKQSMQDWLAQPKYTKVGDLLVFEILPDLLLPLICQLFIHSGWLVGTTIQTGTVSLIPIENSDELHQQLRKFSHFLHDLRKQIKGVRYQTEFFADFYADSYRERVQEFKQIQEILGTLQDHVVLRNFLETTLKESLDKALPSIEHSIQEDANVFWQSWQPLQAHYLSSEFRKSLRSLLIEPLT